MRKAPHRNEEDADVVIDADSGDELAPEDTELAAHSLQAKLKALRTELAACKKERDLNLAGWQRSKADLVNYRRTVAEDRERDLARAKGTLVEALVPVVDSFDSAMAAEAWQSVEPVWREGVERINEQLHKALESHGLQSFGAVGDPFDPNVHDCLSIAQPTAGQEDDTIVQVLQRGYMIDGHVIRPAKVVVAQTS